jgi:GNAT superfamily N-acetyltransferase
VAAYTAKEPDVVRRVTSSDLPLLVQELPMEGRPGAGDQEPYFTEAFRRQERGDGILLVALLDGRPVGDVYVQLGGPTEEVLRERLPGVPLLMHLEVHEEIRNRGIGSAIIARVEHELRGLGHRRVALGVRLDNKKAARLYERLGYTQLDENGKQFVLSTVKVEWIDGKAQHLPDVCWVYVKDLDDSRP